VHVVDRLGDRGSSRVDDGDPFFFQETLQVERIFEFQIDVHF